MSQRLSQPYLSHWDRLPVELKAKIACMAAFPVGDFEILETVNRTGTEKPGETPWTVTARAVTQASVASVDPVLRLP